jgi:hypothetical protein
VLRRVERDEDDDDDDDTVWYVTKKKRNSWTKLRPPATKVRSVSQISRWLGYEALRAFASSSYRLRVLDPQLP